MSREESGKEGEKKKMRGMDFIGAFKPNGFTPRLKTAAGTEFLSLWEFVALPAKFGGWGTKCSCHSSITTISFKIKEFFRV